MRQGECDGGYERKGIKVDDLLSRVKPRPKKGRGLRGEVVNNPPPWYRGSKIVFAEIGRKIYLSRAINVFIFASVGAVVNIGSGGFD